mgnify:CR=1 FL=1
MSNLQFTGTIHKINDVQQISDTFSKREFVVTDGDDKYPKFINFELIKDNVDLLGTFKVGDSITVSFNLDGRSWINPKTNEERFFNSLKAWKIEAGAESAKFVAPKPTKKVAPPEPVDDLPF